MDRPISPMYHSLQEMKIWYTPSHSSGLSLSMLEKNRSEDYKFFEVTLFIFRFWKPLLLLCILVQLATSCVQKK